jgi:hypothetical protein
VATSQPEAFPKNDWGGGPHLKAISLFSSGISLLIQLGGRKPYGIGL